MKERAFHHSPGEYKQEAKPRRGTCSPVLQLSPSTPRHGMAAREGSSAGMGITPLKRNPEQKALAVLWTLRLGESLGEEQDHRGAQDLDKDPRETLEMGTAGPEIQVCLRAGPAEGPRSLPANSPWRLRHSGRAPRWCERRKRLSPVTHAWESLCPCLRLGLRKDLA